MNQKSGTSVTQIDQKRTRNRRLLRVSMLGTLPPLLGISPYCAALAMALAENTKVEFVSFQKHYPKWLYPGNALEDLTTEAPFHANLEIRRRLNWFNPIGWVLEAMRVSGQILHVQWWSLPLGPIMLTVMWIARARGIPQVLTVHNIQPHEKSALYRWVTRALFSQTDRFIVHSMRNASELHELYHVPKEKIRVVPHGVLHSASSSPEAMEVIRSRLQLSPESSIILLFGGIRPYKGVETALEALNLITERNPNVVLLIVGALRMDFRRCQEIIDQRNLHQHVRTVFNYVPESEISNYFCLSDLVILPYERFSSQSGVGLLALSIPRPLIVSDIGALPELVDDPLCVVPPGDPNALADSTIEILTNSLLRERLIDVARVKASEHSWEAIAQKTLSIYDDLTGETIVD